MFSTTMETTASSSVESIVARSNIPTPKGGAVQEGFPNAQKAFKRICQIILVQDND
jgi:hypothetical protein